MRVEIRPASMSSARAARTVVRLTPKRCASATSLGSWTPGFRWPVEISLLSVAGLPTTISLTLVGSAAART